MKASISHIAWSPEEEGGMLPRLPGLGAEAIELAPRRAFGDPLEAYEDAVRRAAEVYEKAGLKITSFQALLFGCEGVHLFESAESRRRMKDVLVAVGRVAGWCGADPMVFGSPKQRTVGDRSYRECERVAVEFFREVGDACAGAGSCLVLEANPEAYGADFITRLDQAADLVARVDSPGFRLHVDAGGMALSGEDFEPVLREAARLLAHAHASQPNLVGWEEPHPVHERLAGVLREIGYTGAVALEMRRQDAMEEGVELALRKMREIYFGE